jgi:hypothetical protein
MFPFIDFDVIPVGKDHKAVEVSSGPMKKEDGVSLWGVYSPDRPPIVVHDLTLMENSETVFATCGLSDAEAIN